MKITKLAYQKKYPSRVNIYVDEKFAVGLDVNDVVKLSLYTGQELSSEHLAKIINESEFGKLFNAALNFLSFRPRSEWEIKQKLSKKTKDESLIIAVLDKLKKIGQIDDAAFTQWYTEQRQTFRPKGKRAIEIELRRKGITTKISSEISETAMAHKAIARYHGPQERDKMARFLASRGFDWDTIKETVDSIVKKDYTNDS